MAKLRYTFSSMALERSYNRDIPKGPSVKQSRQPKDSTCAVFDGDSLIYAGEMERFTKVKHDIATPVLPLVFFKQYGGVASDTKLDYYLANEIEINHHLNHVYECFYQSGFSESAVLVNDGCGNQDDCLTLAYMREGEPPVVLRKFSVQNSPCILYERAACYVFCDEHAEGKLMGLSAYGKDNGRKYIKWNNENKSIETNKHILKRDVANYFQEDADSAEPKDVMLVADIARTVQNNFVDTMIEVVKYFWQMLEEQGICTKNLCMSGGGVLNCPTNSRIVDLGLFERFYASPQPSDGCAEAIGRAFRSMEADGENLRSSRLKTAYFGVSYPSDEIFTRKKCFEYPISQLCSYLSGGGVIAWYQGGAEYGPRALGHRSFLADPSRPEMMCALNTIKGREQWRPLAPVVPERLFHLLFNVENTDMCEFMLRTLPVRERWRDKMQAVCHVDGTTRPQLLKREVNPQLYDLIMAYYEQTGVPCLVNTSLNINGFPIVETPRDLMELQFEISCIKDDVPEVKTVFVENDVGANIEDNVGCDVESAQYWEVVCYKDNAYE